MLGIFFSISGSVSSLRSLRVSKRTERPPSRLANQLWFLWGNGEQFIDPNPFTAAIAFLNCFPRDVDLGSPYRLAVDCDCRKRCRKHSRSHFQRALLGRGFDIKTHHCPTANHNETQYRITISGTSIVINTAP